jgi:hypothetical protein
MVSGRRKIRWMARRFFVAAVVVGALLVGCGAPPEYTPRQARIDMAAFVHVFNAQSKRYDDCIVKFLFNGWSPEQVKTAVQGGDFGGFGSSNGILLAAKYACHPFLPEPGGCRDAAPTATTSPSAPKSGAIETSGGTAYLNLRSEREQILTGTKNQTVVLPNPASINLGDQFTFMNRSTGALTVKSIDYRNILETIATAAPRSTLVVLCKYPTVPAWSASGS